MTNKTVVFITGTGRSGTSALTRLLALSGCTLPLEILGSVDRTPSAANPKGFWEPVAAKSIIHEFHYCHKTSYMDPTFCLEEQEMADDEKERYVRKIQPIFEDCPAGQTLVLKEIGITSTMDLWLEAARREGVCVKVVIPVRHPQEVFGSIAALGSGRKRAPSVELVNAYWVKTNVLTERYTRQMARVFVDYWNLLNDWRAEVARIAKQLAIELTPDEKAIDAFLAPDLCRHRYSGSAFDTFGYKWTSRMYAALSAAARDEELDYSLLDEIYEGYRSMERSFRLASADFINGGYIPEARQLEIARESIWLSGRDF